MTSVNTAREALYQEFNTAWAGATPLVFENEDYEEGTVAWVRFIMRNEDGEQLSMGASGSRHFERNGRVLVQIFTPINVGTSAADTLAENARTILEGKTISGVHIYDVTTREVGVEGKWFYVLVEAPFQFFTTK